MRRGRAARETATELEAGIQAHLHSKSVSLWLVGQQLGLTHLYPRAYNIAPVAVQVDDVQVEVALQWCSDAFSDSLLGFVNSIKTIDGGTHMDGFKAALTRTVNNLGRKNKTLKEGDSNLSGDHVREGLTAIVSVKVRLLVTLALLDCLMCMLML